LRLGEENELTFLKTIFYELLRPGRLIKVDWGNPFRNLIYKIGIEFVQSLIIAKRELTCPPKTDPGCMLGFGSKNLMIREGQMGKKRYQPEQIIGYLREAEILLAKGSTIGQVCRKIGITEQTYYRWRRDYGSLSVDQAKRLKEMEKENVRLKQLVADLSLDKAILKEVAEGKY